MRRPSPADALVVAHLFSDLDGDPGAPRDLALDRFRDAQLAEMLATVYPTLEAQDN